MLVPWISHVKDLLVRIKLLLVPDNRTEILSHPADSRWTGVLVTWPLRHFVIRKQTSLGIMGWNNIGM